MEVFILAEKTDFGNYFWSFWASGATDGGPCGFLPYQLFTAEPSAPSGIFAAEPDVEKLTF